MITRLFHHAMVPTFRWWREYPWINMINNGWHECYLFQRRNVECRFTRRNRVNFILFNGINVFFFNGVNAIFFQWCKCHFFNVVNAIFYWYECPFSNDIQFKCQRPLIRSFVGKKVGRAGK